MCRHYIVDEDQFGVGVNEWCELIVDLLYEFGIYHPYPSIDSESDSDEDIPY